MFKAIATTMAASAAVAMVPGALPADLQGPQDKDSKIAIVGGGPGGIHMATLLEQDGYTNVRIFESTEQVGGKTRSFDSSFSDDQDVQIDSGALYILDDVVYKRFHELLNDLGLEDDLIAVDAPFAIDDEALNIPLGLPEGAGVPLADWFGGRALNLLPVEEQVEFAGKFPAWCAVNPACDPAQFTSHPVLTNPSYPDFIKTYFQASLGAYQGIIAQFYAADPTLATYGFPSYNPATAPLLSIPIDSFLAGPVPPEVNAQIAAGFGLELANLKFMAPIFDIYMTMQGYGQRNTLPMYYAVHWISPAFIDILALRFAILAGLAPTPPVERVPSFMKGGVQAVWDALADELDVKLGANVVSIKRRRNEQYVLKYTSSYNSRKDRPRRCDRHPERCSRTRRYVADFVISAIPAHVFAGLLDETNDKAAILAATSCQTSATWRMTEAMVEQPPYPSSSLYDFGPLNEATATGTRISGSVANIWQRAVKEGKTAGDYAMSAMRDTVLYEINPHDDDEVALPAVSVKSVNDVIVHDNYFSHSEDFATCTPWQILSLQGQDNIWYIGGSVSFESMEAIMSYNHMLMDNRA